MRPAVVSEHLLASAMLLAHGDVLLTLADHLEEYLLASLQGDATEIPAIEVKQIEGVVCQTCMVARRQSLPGRLQPAVLRSPQAQKICRSTGGPAV